MEKPDGLHGNALIIGFGRVGQVVSQPLLARGFEIAMIETDTEMIDAAADFGFKVYYGDGTRLDILHAAGAAEAGVILVCVDDREAAVRIVELCKAEFPLVPVLARAFDRQEALRLVDAGRGLADPRDASTPRWRSGRRRCAGSACRRRRWRRSWTTCASRDADALRAPARRRHHRGAGPHPRQHTGLERRGAS